MTQKVTVAVCTYNGARTLPATLEALKAQTLPSDEFEVIVVDDGSSDDTSAVAVAHGARVLRLPTNQGLAAARNTAVEAARADLIAFTDDDCVPHADWLAELVVPFADATVDAVGGRVVPESTSRFVRGYLQAVNPLLPLPVGHVDSPSNIARVSRYLKSVLTGPEVSGDWLYMAPTANVAFRRSAVTSVGGFSDAFRSVAEDEDLFRRLHARPDGARVAYRATASVDHWFAPSLRDCLRRARSYGRGNARLAREHPSSRLIVYPVPAAVATAALAGRCPKLRIWAMLTAVLLPLAAYPRFLRLAASRKDASPLAYGYIQFAQEVANMVGELEGLGDPK